MLSLYLTMNFHACFRSLEAVDDLVQNAKLDKSDLLPGVQCIYFSSSLNSNDFKLLEVDQAILDGLLSGERLRNHLTYSSFYGFARII